MTDTVESLRAEIDSLRAEFDQFKTFALPVIEGHQPKPDPWPEVIIPLFPEPTLTPPPKP